MLFEQRFELGLDPFPDDPSRCNKFILILLRKGSAYRMRINAKVRHGLHISKNSRAGTSIKAGNRQCVIHFFRHTNPISRYMMPSCLTYIKARQKTFFYAKKKKNAKPLRSQR